VGCSTSSLATTRAAATLPTGGENSFFGHEAGNLNATGSANTFLGNIAGQKNASGADNTFLGARAGTNNTSGNNNIFAGFVAGHSNTTGSQNVFLGNGAGQANTTGQNNTLVGWASGSSNVTGTDNIYLGYTSGQHASGSNNIYLGEISAPLNESNTIRIGTNQTATYIQGVINGNGSGLTGVMPAAGSNNYIQNGTTKQTANFSISGNGTLGGVLAANVINAVAGYQIDGGFVLSSPGFYNLFVGQDAGVSDTTGFDNTFTGIAAGLSNTTGSANTFDGVQAGIANFNGYSNTFVGITAGIRNVSGSGNTFLGADAGYLNQTGGNDIYIGNSGPSSEDESNTIRIGTQGSGNLQQNTAYIAGIYGSTVGGNGIAVYVDSNGQLGTVVSSRRFKEQIHDMGDSSSALMKLRPVTFLYKPEYDKGPRTLQYGLIAEEVAEVYPDLVAYDPDGKPYTVKYQYLTTMLLNEVQKQYHRAEAEAKVITEQEEKIEELEQRFSRLEGVVENSFSNLADQIKHGGNPDAEHCGLDSLGAKCDLSAGFTGAEKRRNPNEAHTYPVHHRSVADSPLLLSSSGRAAVADSNCSLCICCRQRQPAGGQLHRLHSASVQHDQSAEHRRAEGGNDFCDPFPEVSQYRAGEVGFPSLR